jgi:hypothetical protein
VVEPRQVEQAVDVGLGITSCHFRIHASMRPRA